MGYPVCRKLTQKLRQRSEERRLRIEALRDGQSLRRLGRSRRSQGGCERDLRGDHCGGEGTASPGHDISPLELASTTRTSTK
jgi:hypothetical protein